MDALLTKPAGMAELREALYRWMPAAAAGKPAPAAAAQSGSPIDALIELFGPTTRLDELIAGFLAAARDDLAKFDRAMQAGDAAAVAGHIHRIDGAVKIFGGSAFADEGEQIRAALLRHGQVGAQQMALLRYRQDFVALIESLRRHQAERDATPDGARH